jgi:DNA primase
MKKLKPQQQSLFPTSTKEQLKSIDLELKDTLLWYKQGYLSFNPKDYEELEKSHLNELIFLKNIFQVSIPKNVLDYFFSRLNKKIFNERELFFKTEENEFVSQQSIIEGYLQEESIENILDLYESLLDIEEKKEFKKRLKEYLKGL